jgi:hypothetical protein
LRAKSLYQGEVKGLADFCTLFHGGFVGYCRIFGSDRAWKFDLRDLVEDGGVTPPLNGFFFGAPLGLREQAADVGERASSSRRDAVGGESTKEIAEDVVDVDLGDEIAAGTLEFGGEIVFAWWLFGVLLTSVREAEAVMFGTGREAAGASVGEFLDAEVEGVGGTCGGHNWKL